MPTVLEQELERLCTMTAAEKLAVMHSLWRQAWALTRAGVEARHPDWSALEVEQQLRPMFRRDPQ